MQATEVRENDNWAMEGELADLGDWLYAERGREGQSRTMGPIADDGGWMGWDAGG